MEWWGVAALAALLVIGGFGTARIVRKHGDGDVDWPIDPLDIDEEDQP